MIYFDDFEIEGESINLEEFVESAVSGDYDQFIYIRKPNSNAIQITRVCWTSKVNANAGLERSKFIVVTLKMNFARPNYKKTCVNLLPKVSLTKSNKLRVAVGILKA